MVFKTRDIEPIVFSVAAKVWIPNTVIGVAGSAACAVVSTGLAAGFALGFLIGTFSQFLCLRVARAGLYMEPERAKTFVTTRYFARFAMTLTGMLALVAWAGVNPWGLLAGFAVTLLVTIGVMGLAAREACSPDLN